MYYSSSVSVRKDALNARGGTYPSKNGEETERDGALHVVSGARRRGYGLAPRVSEIAETNEIKEGPEC